MKITILDDYHDTIRTLPCFAKLDVVRQLTTEESATEDARCAILGC